MNDLIKANALNNNVLIYCLNSKELVEQARIAHDLYPTSLAALGRVLSVTAIMGKMNKNEKDKVTVTINGKGPIGTIMAEARSNGNVRGFCGDNEIYLKYNDTNKLAVGLAVGTDGYLKVTKDLGMKDSFSGQVALQTGEIGDDFAYYFMVSEQIPSVVSCGVLVDIDNTTLSAGALLIQVMPNATEDDIVAVENLIAKLQPISSMFKETDDPKIIVKSLFDDVEIIEESNVQYLCDCDKERFKAGLTTLKMEDLQEILQEDEKVEIKCEFCNKIYHFDKHDLEVIIDFKKSFNR